MPLSSFIIHGIRTVNSDADNPVWLRAATVTDTLSGGLFYYHGPGGQPYRGASSVLR